MAPATPGIHEGGCTCGAVRYRASGTPFRTLVCHCRFCQRMTGSSFLAQSTFPKAAVESVGVMNVYDHVSETSGKKVHVHFCGTCGTTVMLTFERWPDFAGLPRGTFDHPDRVEVDSHVWTESAQSGVVLPAQTDCFRQARATLDGVPLAPERFPRPEPVSRRIDE